MKNPLVSVVVPVYNVEQYLERCLDSIINQVYKELEIIVVDDGSTDNSGEICDCYAKQDSRVSVWHIENGGLSNARNKGIDCSSGEWICFVDSDDFLHEEYVSQMLLECINNNAEVAVCGMEIGGSDTFISTNEKKVFSYSGIECLLNYYSKDAISVLESACNKLFKRTLFRDVRFIKGRYSEDLAIMHLIFERVNRVVYITCPLYYYYMSPNSISRGKMTVDKLNAVFSWEERVQFFKKLDKKLWCRSLQQYEAILLKYYYLARKYCSEYPVESDNIREKICNTYKEMKIQKDISLLVKIGTRIGTFFPYLVGWLCEKVL